MQLNHLTDEQLDRDLGTLIQSERETTMGILHHLREVDRRRLYCMFKFGSLLEYTVKRWKYSEDQACRRISAMRLLKELPEIEEKIESGALTLTNLAKAQKFFRAEKKAERAKSSNEKRELLAQLENVSLRQADEVIAKQGPEPVTGGSVELQFRASKVLQDKLQRLFDVKSHGHPVLGLHELVEMLADLGLEKWDPMEKAKRAEVRADQKAGSIQKPCVKTEGRSYPSVIRHALYMRDRGVCRNCGSRHQLEIDHVIPLALGGSSELGNLRLLCRKCNQRHAVESYGVAKMSSYLRSTRVEYQSNGSAQDSCSA